MVMKEYSYTTTPLIGGMASTEPRCLYTGALYLPFLFTCGRLTLALYGNYGENITYEEDDGANRIVCAARFKSTDLTDCECSDSAPSP